MGTVFSSAVGNIPAIYTNKFAAWLLSLLCFRLAECSLVRTTRFYIIYDVNGTSTGASSGPTSHVGSFADPWHCATPAHIDTLIRAQSVGGGFRFSLRRGDDFFATSGGTGINLDTANVTLDDYSDNTSTHLLSDDPPCISGFKAAYIGVWTQVGTTHVWYRSDANSIKWIRQSKNPDQAWRHAAPTVAATDSNFVSGSFFHDTGNALGNGANALHVRMLDDSDPNGWTTIQSAVAAGTTDGVLVSDVNGVRVNNIRADGWALNASLVQNYGFRDATSGSNAVVFSNCIGYWNGPTHCAGHYLGSGTGGISTWIGCKFGLSQAIAGASILNHFSAAGGGEFFNFGIQITHGALKDSTSGNGGVGQYIGTAIFSHTATGTNNLVISMNTRGPRAASAFGISVATLSASLPAMSTRDDLAAIRMFRIGEYFEEIGSPGSSQDVLGPWATINGTYNWKIPTGSYTGGALHIYLGTELIPSDLRGGVYINSDIRLDLTGINANAYPSWVNLQAAAPGITFWNSLFQVYTVVHPTLGGIEFGIDSVNNAPSNMPGALWLNSILIASGSPKSGIFFNGSLNATPTITTGGLSGCCFSGFTAATGSYYGYNTSQNYVELGTEAEGLAGPTVASTSGMLTGTGVHPQGWVLEYDKYWRSRAKGAASAAGPTAPDYTFPNLFTPRFI